MENINIENLKEMSSENLFMVLQYAEKKQKEIEIMIEMISGESQRSAIDRKDYFFKLAFEADGILNERMLSLSKPEVVIDIELLRNKAQSIAKTRSSLFPNGGFQRIKRVLRMFNADSITSLSTDDYESFYNELLKIQP